MSKSNIKDIISSLVMSKHDKSNLMQLLNKVENNESSGGGIQIVDSEEKLNSLNVPVGSLAAVAVPGTIKENSFRDLYQPDASILDQSTGTITNPDILSGVSNIKVTAPEGNIEGVTSGVYIIPRDFSQSNPKMITLYVETSNNIVTEVSAMVMVDSYSQLSLITYNEGVSTVDNSAIETINNHLASGDWCYLSSPETQFVITEEQFATLDKFMHPVASVPSTAEVYIKKDNWEKYNKYNEEKIENLSHKINENVEHINNLEDNIPTNINDLNGIEEYERVREKVIYIKQDNIMIGSNTDYYIYQGFVNSITCVEDFVGVSTIDVCIHSLSVIKSGRQINDEIFDYGRCKITFKKDLNGDIIYEYVKIPFQQVDIIYNIPESKTYSFNVSYGEAFLDGQEYKGEAIQQGTHHLTLYHNINYNYGSEYITKVLLSNGTKDFIKLKNSINLETLYIPQSIRNFENSQLDNTPKLIAINLTSTDVCFLVEPYVSGTNSLSSVRGFLYEKYINAIDSYVHMITAPQGCKIAKEGQFHKFKGLLYDGFELYFGIYYKDGLMLSCGNALSISKDCEDCTLIFNNLSEIKNLRYDTLWNRSTPFFNKYIGLKDRNSYTRLTKLVIDEDLSLIDFHGVKCTNITINAKKYSLNLLTYATVANISIGKEVEEIEIAYPFYDVTTITVDENNAVFDSRDNCNALIETSTNKLILGCKNTIIPNTIQIIGNFAFRNVVDLESINIPNSVTEIQSHAFSFCEMLKVCDFSTHNSIPILGSFAFNNTHTDFKIIVPDSLYDDWIVAENWSDYAGHIIKASEYTETT